MADRTVLVVEDDALLRMMIRLTLSTAGYDVREAEDGYAALRKLDTIKPDVIVLDLMMPGVNGHHVLSELAASAYTRDIPVVVITGSDDEAVGHNVHCVLRKPVTPELVLSTVARCVAAAT